MSRGHQILIGRGGDSERLRQLLVEQTIVVVHGPAGVGTTALAHAALADRAPVSIDLADVETAHAIIELTLRRLGLEASDRSSPSEVIAWAIAASGATMIWDHAPAAALDIVAAAAGVGPGRLVVITRDAPPAHVAALALAPLELDATADLVRALDGRRTRTLHEQIAIVACGNPRMVELILDAAHERVQAVAEEVLSQLLQGGDVRRVIAHLHARESPRLTSLPASAMEAFVRDGDLVRAATELARSDHADVEPSLLLVAAAVLPALRGDIEPSRRRLRELVLPPGADGDRAAAVVMTYLCEERYPRAIAAARRARRAYATSDSRRFELLVDVAEVIALLESDRLDDARARARTTAPEIVGAGPMEPLGCDVGALFRAAIYGRRGDLVPYMRLVEPVMASLELRGDRVPYAVAARYVARACVGLGRFDDAERYLNSATTIAAQPGMSALLSVIERERAAFDVACGDLGAARRRLATALSCTPDNPYLSIDAWATSAERDTVLPPACTVYDAMRAYAALRGAERALRFGDHAEASRAADAAERWYGIRGLHYETALAELAGAEAALHAGAYDRCRVALDRCSTLARRHAYCVVAARASLVAAALADRLGDLDQYRAALAAARDHAGELADDPLARACGRLDVQCDAARTELAPFGALVERLGLDREAAVVVTIGRRSFAMASDEALASTPDVVVDLVAGCLALGGERHECADMRLRLLERIADGAEAGVTMETLYLEVWRGREYEPLRHRNSIYVALQRTRAALQPRLGIDPIERIADGCYRLAPSLSVAIRRPRTTRTPVAGRPTSTGRSSSPGRSQRPSTD